MQILLGWSAPKGPTDPGNSNMPSKCIGTTSQIFSSVPQGTPESSKFVKRYDTSMRT